ncbi:hypothetical protein LX15_000316 [Streptoalloteichus tenebrarius]|uniref:Pentapeptide repeat-containing protein n=1 Tax=Streptoalloteichus tenebrarius (strain ATCC 17920 / DSM 40477 / JCM 4838 / CBS 697.72 / NBRC 16177 / NCIMB 11028 / NRRL B-12390 / A12253. 1 / ISP 5477) TaxID=1933 RepID=A0ABT1HMA3_STRSD|nr:hypothetical protein [Streptoalloteichus tenebrarius]MCP2256633.1 hypothetical protein [Streptoalloteichus tenebrarius]
MTVTLVQLLMILAGMGALLLHGRARRRKRDALKTQMISLRQRPQSAEVAFLPMGCAVVGWLALGTGLFATTGYGIYVLLARPQLPTLRAFSTGELIELVKIALAVVAGLGGVVALTVAYRKQRVAEAAHVLAVGQEQREREKMFNERFGTASAQLGDEKFAVRLAGAYALAALAEDWTKQRQTCIDVLCGYIRSPWQEDDQREREIRQTILRLLLERVARHPSRSAPNPDFRPEFDFRGATFLDLDLSRLQLRGVLNLNGCVFRGSSTRLEELELENGEVTFDGAVFETPLTTFAGSALTRSSMSFRGARFRGEQVIFDGIQATSTRLSFTAITVDHAALSFDGSVLENVTLDFLHGKLQNATLDLSRLILAEAIRGVNRGVPELSLSQLTASSSRILLAGTKLFDCRLVLDGARLVDTAVDTTGLVLKDVRVPSPDQPEDTDFDLSAFSES